ncbi:hypothetical protein CYMTET_35665 [Cymbomonas tetramitiformis]|uniref:Uncharacterized protein n=1 Tax=Cymbomonas tetramitiformis TaxID=36881 RepID=A0AAE0F8V3_9CHLO|nr:hypothetical protein CYMTET_35665 [Cymbomonas tetramitiformis]
MVSFEMYVLFPTAMGHVLLKKFDRLYEETHDGLMYPVKLLLRSLALAYSAIVGVYDGSMVLVGGAWSIASSLLLKLQTDLLVEGVSSVSGFFAEVLGSIYRWLVIEGLIDGQPDFLRACFMLQRSSWVARELLILPCDGLRGFWESVLAPLSYYPPSTTNVILGSYYFPRSEDFDRYEAFNKWCFQQNLTGSSSSSDVYRSEDRYCALCDYDDRVRDGCVPHSYHGPLALNAFLVHATTYVQVPVRYVMRVRSVSLFDNEDGDVDSADTDSSDARRMNGRRDDAAVSTSSRMSTYFMTGDGSEMKYSVCWNSYAGYYDAHPDGVPVEPYLHHAPWLLCPDYAEHYRTFDTDRFFTSFIDYLGFGFDALDEWYMTVVDYVQFLVVHETTSGDSDRACEGVWSVHKPEFNATRGTCTATPPALFAFVKHSTQAFVGALRIAARCHAYLPTLLYEIRDEWIEAIDGAQGSSEKDREGLVHQIVETPNTIGCERRDYAEYPSTTSKTATDPDEQHYCARNYAIDSFEMSLKGVADIVRSTNLTEEADVALYASRALAGKLRLAYRLVAVSVFGPYRTPPTPPAYPAPPSPPPAPPPAPKCMIPAVRYVEDAENGTVSHEIGLEAWQSYGCGAAELNPMADILEHDRLRGNASNVSFWYYGKRWTYNEEPVNATVECYFVPAYDAYRREAWAHSLCPVPEEREEDPDADMCTLSGYPSSSDASNVDTSDLRTLPNVFIFSDAHQEGCGCDDESTPPVDTDVVYTCPAASWYPPVKTASNATERFVASYLVDAEHPDASLDSSLGYYTREGDGDIRYPVCRGLQVVLFDDSRRNVSYDYLMRERCDLSEGAYTDGLVSEGYGVQTECSLVAITDISNDTLRREATFVIRDEARVMRLPVRVVRRQLNRSDDATDDVMLSPTVDLLAQGPAWTSRVAEQAFDGGTSASVTPVWSEFKSIGGSGAGMHQPLCSCDPVQYVPPTAVADVRHCAPRRFEKVPPPPHAPAEPAHPPPPYPAFPPLNNDTVCRNAKGAILDGYHMRYFERDIFPEHCVCRYTNLVPVSSHNIDNRDTYYCPAQCDDLSIADGPTCVCRATNMSVFEIGANGGKRVPPRENPGAASKQEALDTSTAKLVEALNALSRDVASPEAKDAGSDDRREQYEFAYSFNFEKEEYRFPTLRDASAPNFCERAAGTGWDLYNFGDDVHLSMRDMREQLQKVVDAFVNDWTMSATGAAFMDAHALCADRYRIAVPSVGRVFYTGNASRTSQKYRATMGLARSAWRIVDPRNFGNGGAYDEKDAEYIDAAMMQLLEVASESSYTSDSCVVHDKVLANANVQSAFSLLERESSDDGPYRASFSVNRTCEATEENMLTMVDGRYRVRCVSREDDAPVYTAADAHNVRFASSSEGLFRARYQEGDGEDAKYGLMHVLDKYQRVTLLNQTGEVSSSDECVLPKAYEHVPNMHGASDVDTDVCEMYVNERHLHKGVHAAQHPKGAYVYPKGALLERRATLGAHYACSNESQSELQGLCHDANVLSPEQMAQAATYCGFSKVAESVRPVGARTGCRAVPYGFVVASRDSGTNRKDGGYTLYPLAAPTEPIGDKTDQTNRSLRVLAATVLDSGNVEFTRDRGHRLIAVCAKPVPRRLRRTVLTSAADGSTASRDDGTRSLGGEELALAREAVTELDRRAAKCALDSLDTFPFLDTASQNRLRPLYSAARPNAAQRLLTAHLDHRHGSPWPYPWTKRGRLRNASRVTIGAVLLDGLYSSRAHAELSAIGPLVSSERLPYDGGEASFSFPGPSRLLKGFVGRAQEGARYDPFVYEKEVAFVTGVESEATQFGTSVSSQLSQRVFVVERCDQRDLHAGPLFRIRSLADNRFVGTKGTFAHPSMPSKSVNATQLPMWSRASRNHADAGLFHERFHVNGTFEARSRSELESDGDADAAEGVDPAASRSSTIYLVQRSDESFLSATSESDRARLYDFGGYLFENDLHLTHGASSDVGQGRATQAGDFDAMGNVGLFGLTDEGSVGDVPRRDLSSPLDEARLSRKAPSSHNRQLFSDVRLLDGAPRAHCTVETDANSSASSPQDSRMDRDACESLQQRAYSKWARGYPMHGAVRDRGGLQTTFSAGTFDCVALNVLTGSHCAIHGDEDCELGRDVRFGEWVTLPCSQRKPFACSDGNADLQIVSEPLAFDDARLHCRRVFGESYDLASTPVDDTRNARIAAEARSALCGNRALDVYGDPDINICDLSPDKTAATTHTRSSLRNLSLSSDCVDHSNVTGDYRCCETTSAYLMLADSENASSWSLVRNRVGRAIDDDGLQCEDGRAGSFARGSFYTNGDTITTEDEHMGGRAWNLQLGDVWIGYRRHVSLAGFPEQNVGRCDLTGKGPMANSMLFEIAPCKDDNDAHVFGEFAVIGHDGQGRSLVLATQQAIHPFDADGLEREVATRNADAFLRAVNSNRTAFAPGTFDSTDRLLDDYRELMEDGDSESPLRQSVWAARSTTLKLFENGFRREVSVENSRAGRCFESVARDDSQTHNISVVTCNVAQNCGTVQFTVRTHLRTGLSLIPVDGESSEELLQNLFPDLTMGRPCMHSHRVSSSLRRRTMRQTTFGEALFNWRDGSDANETLRSTAFRRSDDLSTRGTEFAFALNRSYGTRGVADSAVDMGDRVRTHAFGGLHAASDVAETNFSMGRGVVDFHTFLHALNESTYPCDDSTDADATYPYDADTCERLAVSRASSSPQIERVVAPSTCGANSETSDEWCTLLAMLTGRSLGFVEGVHRKPRNAETFTLRRLDAIWNSTDDAATPSLFTESDTDRNLREIASRSNRASLWYPPSGAMRSKLSMEQVRGPRTTGGDSFASQGWLYTCSGKVLKFEPGYSLSNPPAPASPKAPVDDKKENTNNGKFQVTAGGVLTRVDASGYVEVRRNISEAYVVSSAADSVNAFQRTVDSTQPYRPQSAYNTYSFSGVEALSATVEYGAPERAAETESECGFEYASVGTGWCRPSDDRWWSSNGESTLAACMRLCDDTVECVGLAFHLDWDDPAKSCALYPREPVGVDGQSGVRCYRKRSRSHYGATCRRYVRDVYVDGSMSDTRAKEALHIRNGARDAALQTPDLDLHYVGGPRLRLPLEYTRGWQPPVANKHKEGVDLWIRGRSVNQTGVCAPDDERHVYGVSCDATSECRNVLDPPSDACVDARRTYLETAAHDACGNPRETACQDDDAGLRSDPAVLDLSDTDIRWNAIDSCEAALRFSSGDSAANSLYNMPADTGFVCDTDAGMRACEDRSHYRTSVTDAEYDNLRRKCENLVRAAVHYCPHACDACPETSGFYEGSGRLHARDATERLGDESGRRLCTCDQTSPDYHCRPLAAEVSNETYVTVSGDVVERPEARFMNRFLQKWNSVPDPQSFEFNKVLPVVDMWNDVGAHGGSKYDTEFLWSTRQSGWMQNEGNMGPGRVLVTFPYNNEDGDVEDFELQDDRHLYAYSRSDKRQFGSAVERLSDFSSKETFKMVSDLVADMCDDFTFAYRRANSSDKDQFAQPCMGFAAQDLFVYDAAPYDLDDLLSAECDSTTEAVDERCEQHRYQMMTSHYYPSYQSWRYHRSNETGWDESRDGLLYALGKTREENPSGPYSRFQYDPQQGHASSQESLYSPDSEFDNAFAARDVHDLHGRGAIRAFLFTLYGKGRYSTTEEAPRRRQRLESLHVSHAAPWTSSASSSGDVSERRARARRGRSGAPREHDRPDVSVAYERFLPVGKLGGTNGSACSSADCEAADDVASVHTRHSGHLFAAHTSMDLRERYYYPAFVYQTMSDDALNNLHERGMLDNETHRAALRRGNSSKPIEILWPPPEVTLWTRVAEQERARVPARELFGEFSAPSSIFAETNGAWRLRHAPTAYERTEVGRGEYFDVVDEETSVRPAAPPHFGLIWNRYLRNRVPTCYREDTQGVRHFNVVNHTRFDCERLKPALGYDEGRLGPEYVAPPPLPLAPSVPSPPPTLDYFRVYVDKGKQTQDSYEMLKKQNVYVIPYSGVKFDDFNYMEDYLKYMELVRENIDTHDGLSLTQCEDSCRSSPSTCTTYNFASLHRDGDDPYTWCVHLNCGERIGNLCDVATCEEADGDRDDDVMQCKVDHRHKKSSSSHTHHWKIDTLRVSTRNIISPPPPLYPPNPVTPPSPDTTPVSARNFDIYQSVYLANIEESPWAPVRHLYELMSIACYNPSTPEECADKSYYLISTHGEEDHFPSVSIDSDASTPEAKLKSTGEDCAFYQGVRLSEDGVAQGNAFATDSCLALCEASADACEMYLTFFEEGTSSNEYQFYCALVRRIAHNQTFNLTELVDGEGSVGDCAQVGVSASFAPFVQLEASSNTGEDAVVAQTEGGLPQLTFTDNSIGSRFLNETESVQVDACAFGDGSERFVEAAYVYPPISDYDEHNPKLSMEEARDICHGMNCEYYVRCGPVSESNPVIDGSVGAYFYLSAHDRFVKDDEGSCEQTFEPHVCSTYSANVCTCKGMVYYGKKFVQGEPGSGAVRTFEQTVEDDHATRYFDGETLPCEAETFDGDPNVGYYKHCYCQPDAYRCVAGALKSDYAAPVDSDWLDRHRRMYRASWTYGLVADSYLLDYAYRPKADTRQTKELLSVPENDGGYLDGNAFWQFDTFSWAFAPKHDCYPKACGHDSESDTAFTLSRAVYHSAMMRKPDYLDLSDATEDQARAQAVLDELGALGAWICGENHAATSARESNRCSLRDGDTDMRVLGPRIVLRVDRLRGGVERGETLWAEAASTARRICRAINENALAKVAGGDLAPLPESVVECATAECSAELERMTPVWVVCKAVAVSFTVDGVDVNETDVAAQPRTRTVSLGFALDGMLRQVQSTETVHAVSVSSAESDSDARRLLHSTDCDRESWRGMLRPSEWIAKSVCDTDDVECDALHLGTCATTLALEDVRIDALDTDGKLRYDESGVPLYAVGDAEIEMGSSVGESGLNLCQAFSFEATETFFASNFYKAFKTPENVDSGTLDDTYLPCDSDWCVDARVTERWSDLPTLGFCATLAAPVDPRLLASDHGFFWGPSISARKGTVYNHRVTHSDIFFLSNHSDTVQDLPESGEEMVKLSKRSHEAHVAYGTENSSLLINTLETLFEGYLPNAYTTESQHLLMKSDGFRARGFVRYESYDNEDTTSVWYAARSVLPVFAYDMYDVHFYESNTYNMFRDETAHYSEYVYGSALTSLGATSSAVLYGLTYPEVSWKRTLYTSFKDDYEGSDSSPFTRSTSDELAKWNVLDLTFEKLYLQTESELDASEYAYADSSTSSASYATDDDIEYAHAEASFRGYEARIFNGDGNVFADYLDLRNNNDIQQDMCETFALRDTEETRSNQSGTRDSQHDPSVEQTTFNWELYYRFTCYDRVTRCESPSALEDSPTFGPFRNAYFDFSTSKSGFTHLTPYRVTGDHAHAVLVVPPTGIDSVCDGENATLRIYRRVGSESTAAFHLVEPSGLAGNLTNERTSFYGQSHPFNGNISSSSEWPPLSECYVNAEADSDITVDDELIFARNASHRSGEASGKLSSRLYERLDSKYAVYTPCDVQSTYSKSESTFSPTQIHDRIERMFPGLTNDSVSRKMREYIFQSETLYTNQSYNYTEHVFQETQSTLPFLSILNYWNEKYAEMLYKAHHKWKNRLVGFLDDVPLDAGDTVRSCVFRSQPNYEARRLQRAVMTEGDKVLDDYAHQASTTSDAIEVSRFSYA